MFPNVLQFCWVSISSFMMVKMLPFIHQTFYLFSYLMHSYCGWKKKKNSRQKRSQNYFSSGLKFTLFRWIGSNWSLKKYNYLLIFIIECLYIWYVLFNSTWLCNCKTALVFCMHMEHIWMKQQKERKKYHKWERAASHESREPQVSR